MWSQLQSLSAQGRFSFLDEAELDWAGGGVRCGVYRVLGGKRDPDRSLTLHHTSKTLTGTRGREGNTKN